MTMTRVIEREPGSRFDRRRARRRRRTKVVLAAVLVAAVGAGAFFALREPPAPPRSVIGAAGEGEQVTTLVSLSLHDAPTPFADSLTVFAVDRTGEDPLTLFVPSGTLTQIPGLSFTRVGTALEGSPFLLRISVENLLGVAIDRSVVLDDVTFGQVIDALGGVEIDVRENVVEKDERGGSQRVFSQGPQRMDAATAVTYMTFRGEDTELDRFVRQQKMWTAIFRAGPARIRDAVASLDRATLPDADRRALAETLATMAARPQGEHAFEVLPARAVTSGGADEAYQVDERRLDTLVRRELRSSTFSPGPVSARPRVEIRNGNGKPEGGRQVAALLIEAGMKIVVSGNASSFDFRSTRIVVYGDDADALALGGRIKDLIGAGSVEVGTRGQGVVDATVVVGLDIARS